MTAEPDDWLTRVLHDERVAASTQQIDCWACEAAKSPAIAELRKALDSVRARADHTQAVLDRAVPDAEAQKELWKDHWRAQIAARRAPEARS